MTVPSTREAINVFWQHYRYRRVLFHAYILTRIEIGNVSPILVRHHSGMDKDPNKDFETILETLIEANIIQSDGTVINDSTLSDNNPYKIIEDNIYNAIGDFDKLRIYGQGKVEEYTFVQFYRLAFKKGSKFREVTWQNLTARLGVTEANYEVLHDHGISNADVLVLQCDTAKRLLILCTSSTEISVDSIYAASTLARVGFSATPLIIGIAFSREALKGGELYDVDLVTFLNYLKLSVTIDAWEGTHSSEQKLLALWEIFENFKGGILDTFS